MADEFRLKFTVAGNQEKEDGNPIPYVRTTQRGSWGKQVTRYHYFCAHVRVSFLDACQAWYTGQNEIRVGDVAIIRPYSSGIKQRPISILVPATEIYVSLTTDITFRYAKDGIKPSTHGDPDNVLKGVLDALFTDDKAVREAHIYSGYGDAGSIDIALTIRATPPSQSP